MVHAGAGLDPARPPAERHPGRPLWPADPASRRAPARRRRPRQPAVPAPLSRLPAAWRSLPARVRGRSRARAGRPLVGAGRSHAGALRRRLRAREPDHPLPLPARDVPGSARPQARQLLSVDARQPGRRYRSGQSASGSADPRSGRRGLLRARVSRALSRLHARRGRRPHRARRSRLSEIGGRTETRRPDPTAHRRGGVRSAGAARRFPVGGRRVDPGGARRKCRRGRRARQRLGGNQGDAAVSPTPVPPTVLRGPATSEHADLVVRRRAGARLRSRQSRSALDRLRLQASLAAVENHQRRSRRRSFRARTTRRHRPDHDAQPRVRRPGAGAAVDDAGMDSGRPAAAADDAAGVSGGDQGRRLCRHARRPDPRLGVARCARRRAAPG